MSATSLSMEQERDDSINALNQTNVSKNLSQEMLKLTLDDNSQFNYREWDNKHQQEEAYLTTEKTTKLFVGGLTHDVTEQQLIDYFSKYGKIEECTIMVDKNTHKSRGFGFLTFLKEDSVDQVMEVKDQHLMNGKWIDCKPAKPINDQSLQKAKQVKIQNQKKASQLQQIQKRQSGQVPLDGQSAGKGNSHNCTLQYNGNDYSQFKDYSNNSTKLNHDDSRSQRSSGSQNLRDSFEQPKFHQYPNVSPTIELSKQLNGLENLPPEQQMQFKIRMEKLNQEIMQAQLMQQPQLYGQYQNPGMIPNNLGMYQPCMPNQQFQNPQQFIQFQGYQSKQVIQQQQNQQIPYQMNMNQYNMNNMNGQYPQQNFQPNNNFQNFNPQLQQQMNYQGMMGFNGPQQFQVGFQNQQNQAFNQNQQRLFQNQQYQDTTHIPPQFAPQMQFNPYMQNQRGFDQFQVSQSRSNDQVSLQGQNFIPQSHQMFPLQLQQIEDRPGMTGQVNTQPQFVPQGLNQQPFVPNNHQVSKPSQVPSTQGLQENKSPFNTVNFNQAFANAFSKTQAPTQTTSTTTSTQNQTLVSNSNSDTATPSTNANNTNQTNNTQSNGQNSQSPQQNTYQPLFDNQFVNFQTILQKQKDMGINQDSQLSMDLFDASQEIFQIDNSFLSQNSFLNGNSVDISSDLLAQLQINKISKKELAQAVQLKVVEAQNNNIRLGTITSIVEQIIPKQQPPQVSMDYNYQQNVMQSQEKMTCPNETFMLKDNQNNKQYGLARSTKLPPQLSRQQDRAYKPY